MARDTWEDVATGRYMVCASGPSGATESGFDGVTTWQHGRSGVAYTLGDVDSALVAADESFRVARAWWFRERHAATIALIGRRTDRGHSFDILSITPEGGRSFDAWIDRSSHLLARTEEQQAEDKVVTTYADYRRVHGVMVPFVVRTGNGGDSTFDDVEMVQSVELNPVVPDSRYAIPPVPPSDVELPAGRTSVDVPFRLAENNRILVPITVNDHVSVEAEFDSGGSLLLQPASVAKLGVASDGRHRQGGGGEGTTSSSVGRIDRLQLGEASLSGLAFHSFALDPEAPEEALIGLEVLQRLVVRFDFDRMVMTLTRPESFQDDGSGTVVPFHFQDNQPEVKGSVDGIAGLFAIDTGDNSSLLLIAPFARRYGLAARYHADIPYDGQAISATHGVWARARAGSVTLDGADGRPAVTVHDPVTRISLQHSGFDANRNVSANIGLGILRQFNLTFDYARQRLILQPNHFFGQRDIFNRTGFRLKREGAGWTIALVYPHSPAADAGLKVGDRILSISGRTPTEIADAELSTLLKGPIGSSVAMTVSNATGARDVTILLREVI